MQDAIEEGKLKFLEGKEPMVVDEDPFSKEVGVNTLSLDVKSME